MLQGSKNNTLSSIFAIFFNEKKMHRLLHLFSWIFQYTGMSCNPSKLHQTFTSSRYSLGTYRHWNAYETSHDRHRAVDKNISLGFSRGEDVIKNSEILQKSLGLLKMFVIGARENHVRQGLQVPCFGS